MTLEEMEAKITELNGTIKAQKKTIVGMEDIAKNVYSKEDYDKAIQKADNQGFDRGSAKVSDDKKDFISKTDVDEMLSERDRAYNTQKELLAMGIKDPVRALKMLDEDDVKAFGTDDFKVDDFKSKYKDVLMFKDEEVAPANVDHKPFTQNNTKTRQPKLTAETYAELPKEERMKVSKEDRDLLT